MVEITDILTEYVRELGDSFVIDAVTPEGVAFYHINRGGLKFSIVRAPMFGVPEGYIGFVTYTAGMSHVDGLYRYEDPQILEKLTGRISAWLSNSAD